MPTVEFDAKRGRKRALGRFYTPSSVAEFMANLFESVPDTVRLLDPGAGTGVLTHAMVSRLCSMERRPKRVEVSAFEIDDNALVDLRQTLDQCSELCADAGIAFEGTVFHEDFIVWGASTSREDLFSAASAPFTTIIMNPPYRKIRSDSHARWHLRFAGLETSNLYSGFLALAASLLCDGGELVAITPRSFCNGPYFRPFREQFLRSVSLHRIHIFESRYAAFRTDGVLQENVILHARKSHFRRDYIIVSSSDDHSFATMRERRCDYEEIIAPDDPEHFIHIVADDGQQKVRQQITTLSDTLSGLGLSVSTGRVVDFRAKEYLCPNPEPDTAPLIYPCHFRDGYVEWPKSPSRKPNALAVTEQTRKLLVPNARYVLVKRFSSKEERKRIVACIHDPKRVPGSVVGFENHLNYFHLAGSGLSAELAAGLATYLNSTLVDSYFRQFNGHTQVNATDLRKLPYPSYEQLLELGRHSFESMPDQTKIDQLVERVLFHGTG